MWIYKGQEVTSISQVPAGSIGFIYQITDLTNDKIYVGKKSVFSTRKKHFTKKQKSQITDKRIKTYTMVTTEMAKWVHYTGSSKELNQAIADGAQYVKEILQYCRSKQELTYYEIKFQMSKGVIEPGNRSYNENIAGKFYPKLFVISDD